MKILSGRLSLLIVLFFAKTGFAEGTPAALNACFACHGVKGISGNGLWPNLAGQKEDYLVKQLKAFRSGERKDTLMNVQAVNLSDEDITKIAAFFSGVN